MLDFLYTIIAVPVLFIGGMAFIGLIVYIIEEDLKWWK